MNEQQKQVLKQILATYRKLVTKVIESIPDEKLQDLSPDKVRGALITHIMYFIALIEAKHYVTTAEEIARQVEEDLKRQRYKGFPIDLWGDRLN